MEDQYLSIGVILKPYGVNGELNIRIDDPFVEDFLRAKLVFLEMHGNQTPFFIQAGKKRSELVVKFEEVNTREEASRLVRKELFLRRADLSFEPGEELLENDFAMLTGFVIEDEERGRVGAIEEVLELPQQWMAVVQYAEKELLIPLNEAFIREIDAEQQIIYMDLPEGLLEL